MTAAARRADLDVADTVLSRRSLATHGFTAHRIDAQVAARRWQRFGPAVVLHNSALTADERALVYVINCGPRAVSTSFTALAQWGLRGWNRDEIHVLAPAGTSRPSLPNLQLHRPGVWRPQDVATAPRRHLAAPALVIAAGSFENVRSACGVVAAGVQQRLTTARELHTVLEAAPRARHRRQLLLAVADIAGGAEALSEIDFVRLCRRHGLPEPTLQAVRREPSGRRRYLDVEWHLANGHRVAVEIDGAHHLDQRHWAADQLRQNEIVLGGTLVLRYPSVMVRSDPDRIVAQLRRVLR